MTGKIYISYLLDMGDIELQNWLIENIDKYVLVEKSKLEKEFDIHDPDLQKFDHV